MHSMFEYKAEPPLARTSVNLDCSFFERENCGEALKYNACYDASGYMEAVRHVHNRYENYEQYVDTVNVLNAFLEGDHEKFSANMVRLGKDYDFKIIVNFSGVPFNPFALGYKEIFDGREEKTLREIMSGYKKTPEREHCLAILENFSPHSMVYRNMGW